MPAEFYIRLSEACLSVEFVPSDLIEASGHLAHGTLASDHLSAAHWVAFMDGELCAQEEKYV